MGDLHIFAKFDFNRIDNFRQIRIGYFRIFVEINVYGGDGDRTDFKSKIIFDLR
ncbi:MAG: hypothetical protein V1928_01810 [Parcubacteria group bacterium]